MSDITADELRTQLKFPNYTWYQRLYQIVCFFIFLGPIRLIMAICLIILFGAAIIGTRLVVSLFGFNPDVTRDFNYWYATFGVRLFIMCFGIIWIDVDGEIDDDTRIVLANHVSFIDPLAIICFMRVSCLLKIEFSRVPWIRGILSAVDPIYVDRTKRTGASKHILEHAKNPETFPILIFPEGTIARGEIMLKFHTGAFTTPYKVQGICVRYISPFLPRKWNSYVWAGQKITSLIWSFISMPFSVCQLKILPAKKLEQFDNNVEKFAEYQQLTMANELGLKAVSASSDVIFKAKAKKEDVSLSQVSE